VPQKENDLRKIAKERMGEMFGQKKDFRGLNAFFPKICSSEAKHTLPKKDTVPKKSTLPKLGRVPKVGTVLNNATLLEKLNPVIKSSVQLVYLNFYKLSHSQNQTTTDCLGYKEIAVQCNISYNTARRAIHTLVQKRLIERVEIKNEKDVKGSRYRVILPAGIEGVFTDKMTIVGKKCPSAQNDDSAQKGHSAQFGQGAHK